MSRVRVRVRVRVGVRRGLGLGQPPVQSHRLVRRRSDGVQEWHEVEVPSVSISVRVRSGTKLRYLERGSRVR